MLALKILNQCIIFMFISFHVAQDRNWVEAKVRVTYLEMKDTVVIYANPSFFYNITFTSRTYGSNPLYFVTIAFTSLKAIDYSTKVDFYSYAYIASTNTYMKSIEIHLNWCDFIYDQSVFTSVLKKKYIKEAAICPAPPGSYHFENMTAPYGRYLKNFPFQQGRVYINVTLNNEIDNELIYSARMDLQVKEMPADKFHKYADD